MKISVCCITKNEEVHIERLIRNINDIAEEIIVVDSFSTDNTIKILEKYNCKIFKRKFDNFSNQKNYCLSKVSDNSQWVLFLDADELLTQELKNEILTIENKTYDAYEIKRKFYWKNKWVKRGYYPSWFLRIGKKQFLRFDDNEINEHMLCSSNNIGRLSENFIDYNLKTTKQWFQKHLMYAKMESNRFYYKKETQRKRIIWNKFPLIIRPFLLLFYRLILKMSILDGLYIIQYHFYHDFIYRMIIDIMILKKKIFKK